MGMVSMLCRTFVVVVNIIFLVVGLICFALGMFLRFGQDYITDEVKSVEQSIETSLADAGFGTVDINFDIYNILFGMALVFIFLGLLVIAITMFGCCGSCYKIKCLLILYVVICGILLIGQIVNIILCYGFPDTIRDPIKTQLKEDIQSDYMGINGTNVVSMAWNIVMQEVGCCGVDSYADFTGGSQWTIDYTSKTPPVTLKTPLCCCYNLPSDDDFSCAGSGATSVDNYLNTGCVDKIWDQVIGSSLTVIIVGVVCGFQVILLSFAVIILCSLRNDKKNKITPTQSSNTNQVTKTQKGGAQAGQRGRGNQGYGQRRRPVRY